MCMCVHGIVKSKPTLALIICVLHQRHCTLQENNLPRKHCFLLDCIRKCLNKVLMPGCPSGNSFPQQEVGVLFPSDDALHLKRVDGDMAGGDHVTLQLPERPLTNQLDSHWSDAAFDPERPVEGAVGLQTCVQLCVFV